MNKRNRIAQTVLALVGVVTASIVVSWAIASAGDSSSTAVAPSTPVGETRIVSTASGKIASSPPPEAQGETVVAYIEGRKLLLASFAEQNPTLTVGVVVTFRAGVTQAEVDQVVADGGIDPKFYEWEADDGGHGGYAVSVAPDLQAIEDKVNSGAGMPGNATVRIVSVAGPAVIGKVRSLQSNAEVLLVDVGPVDVASAEEAKSGSSVKSQGAQGLYWAWKQTTQ